MRIRRRLWAGAWLALAASAAVHAQAERAADRGAQLYDGRLPLTATVRGHTQVLPAQASRCINCHEPSRQPGQNDAAFAPRLDRASLTSVQQRRGGPTSAYDEGSLCRLLRESLDPTLILVNKSMPRYTLTNEDCAALWQFLANRPAETAKAP